MKGLFLNVVRNIFRGGILLGTKSARFRSLMLMAVVNTVITAINPNVAPTALQDWLVVMLKLSWMISATILVTPAPTI